MDSPDLQLKYQKLAFEYSKLRAQNQVLKKAIIEEQEKSSQLKENLKLRDQNIRKAEQEIDSLSFRNQQLTKRLSLLQDDLEVIKNKPRKGRTKLDSQIPISVSIHDNNVYAQELESKIRENARLHAELTDVEIFYKTKVTELESHLEESSRVAIKSSEDIKTYEHLLKNEIKKLEGERVLQEVQAQQREAKIIMLEKQLRSFCHEENKLDTDAYSKGSPCVLEKLPINLPTPSEEKSQEISNGKFIFNLSKPVKEVCFGFGEFFVSYSSLLMSSSSISSSQMKIADQLVRAKNTWHLLHQRYEEMFSGVEKDESVRLENLIGMNEFNKAFNNCVSSFRRLLPILSERWACFQDGQLDAPWISTLGRIVSCFAALNPYISSLAAYSDGRVSLTALAVRKILFFLHERICKLHSTSQELLTAWELLNIGDEKREEAIKKPISSIENALHKIISILGANILSNRSEENEHSGSPSSVYSQSPGTPHLVSHQYIAYFGTPMSEVVVDVGSTDEREKEIRSHFTNRCSQLYMQLTSCISQAALYQNECETLLKRLALTEDTNRAAEKEAEKQRREKTQIQENLSITSRNYEEQISTMSDHLADMSEKITLQVDIIEQLKFELKNKSKK